MYCVGWRVSKLPLPLTDFTCRDHGRRVTKNGYAGSQNGLAGSIQLLSSLRASCRPRHTTRGSLFRVTLHCSPCSGHRHILFVLSFGYAFLRHPKCLCIALDEVYFPRLFWTDETCALTALLGTAWSLFLTTNFVYHYYSAVTILPGSPHDPPGCVRRRPFWTLQSGRRSLSESDPGNPAPRRTPVPSSDAPRTCKKCKPLSGSAEYTPKPERAHHCSVCQTCWLKYDHQ